MRPDKSIIYLLFVVIATSCTQSEQKARMPKQYTSEQLRNNAAIEAAGFNNDDTKLLIDNNSTGIFNVYVVNVADTNMQPLTKSTTDSYFAVGFLPGTNKFIFTHDKGGNENNHLYLKQKKIQPQKILRPGKTVPIACLTGALIKNQCM